MDKELQIVIGIGLVVLLYVLIWLAFRGVKESRDVEVPARSARLDSEDDGGARVPGVPSLPENLVRMADRSKRLRGAGFSTPAAKGIARDESVGRDQMSREDRARWTGNGVRPWGIQ